MKAHEVDASIGEALRIDRRLAEDPGIGEAKRELLAGIVAEPQAGPEAATDAGRRTGLRFGSGLPRARYLALGSGVATAAATVLLATGIGAGPAGSPAPALANNLRLARVSPHVLLEAPGWRIAGASEIDGKRGEIRFFHGSGKPVFYLDGRLSIAFQAAAELRWRSDPLAGRIQAPGSVLHPDSRFSSLAEVPILGATARVYARSVPEYRARQFAAVWIQGGRYLRFRSFAPTLSTFERRLSSLRRVSRNEWFQALPTHRVRQREWTPVESPGVRQAIPDCGRPLPAALSAREGNRMVRQFKRICRVAERFGG